MGEALACFITDTVEIEVNLPIAFGKATTPEMVGDLRERKNQYDFPEATGVILHEALHARFSGWNFSSLETPLTNKEVAEAFWLLEESRIEGLGVYYFPENALFMRASAMGLSFAEAEEHLATITKTGAMAHLAGLTLARVTAGVLDEFDVAPLAPQISAFLGDTLPKLEAIWTEFQSLSLGQVTRGVELAEAWVEAVREKAEENGEKNGDPEKGEGEPNGEGKGGSLADLLGELIDDLREAMENSALDTASDLADQEKHEQRKDEAKSKASESERRKERKDKAEKISGAGTGAGESGSSSRLTETRLPSAQERAGAVKVAQMLEKAKYQERSVIEVGSVAPAGRLNTRAVIQREAYRAQGIKTQVPTWRKTVRKHTDDPNLSIGVLVDVSGSMGSAMNPMAITAWILSEAGRRVQAKTAMVYFGSGVFSTLKVGQRLDKVQVYTAPDGTEKFGEAYKALDGELGLTWGVGAKLLVVVSDGEFVPSENRAVTEAIAECARTGVAVLWVSPEAWNYRGATSLTDGTHAVHLIGTEGGDPTTIAIEVGKSATKALEKFGGRV
jgi:hypothetical protein